LEPETAAAHTNQGVKIKTRSGVKNARTKKIYVGKPGEWKKSSANARTAFVAGFSGGPRTLEVDIAAGSMMLLLWCNVLHFR